VFDASERRAGPFLERTVNSTYLVELFTFGMAWQRRMNTATERNLRRILHAWNVPAGSDVKRVSEQIASLERRVRDLSKHVEELGGADAHVHDHSRP
jgi:hypothetical protein